MKSLKLILVAFVLTLSISTAAIAGSPKTETKAKPETTTVKPDAKSTVTTTYNYFVTGETIVGTTHYYNVGTSDPGCDDSGDKPCAVVSNMEEDGGKILESAVTKINSTRTDY